MKKVVFVKESLPGGTENYCIGLHDLLQDAPGLTMLPVQRIPQQHSRFTHYSYNEEVLRSHIADADIVHVNGYTAQGNIDAIKLAHRMGKKIVYTAHFHPFEYLSRPKLAKLFFDFRIKPLVKKYADVVTTINNEDTAFFQTFHSHVVMIPHWNRRLTENVPAETVERNPRMILFVGRINDQVKNFGQLLALPEGKYEIHCVGKGEIPVQRPDIIQHQNISDQELSALYRQSSLLVVPSRYEAFSFASLEALSQGTPVVMSDRVRIADHLEGIQGYSIYNYNDTCDFLAKVESTIGTAVDSAMVEDRFNPQMIADKYRELYLSL